MDTYIQLLPDDVGGAPSEFEAPLMGATEGQPDVPNGAETEATETAVITRN
jgi:hypothetical protein